MQNAEDFVESLDDRSDYDVVHSNSALEHIRLDRFVLEQVCEWARSRDRPVAQIHIVPATAPLALYRCYGYRVYSAADVQRLTTLFEPAQTHVIGLGGLRSWLLHLLRLRDRERRPER